MKPERIQHKDETLPGWRRQGDRGWARRWETPSARATAALVAWVLEVAESQGVEVAVEVSRSSVLLRIEDSAARQLAGLFEGLPAPR